MAFPSYSTGTASVSAGGTTVTAGGGANWSTTNVQPGDTLQIGEFQTIIDDNTSSTLTIPPWGGGAQSSVAYKIFQTSALRIKGGTDALDVSRLIAALNTTGYFVFVGAAETVPDPSYGEDGQFAYQPATGKTWAKTGGAWVLQPTLSFGIRQNYSTTTTDADPGAGNFRFNHATPASATAVYLDNVDAAGTTVSSIWDTLDDSTSTVRGVIRFQKANNPTVWVQFNVTGSVVTGTGYRKLTLASGVGSGAFTNADEFVIAFSRTGDVGNAGANGSQGPAAGIRQAYSSTTADADPGAGTFRLNHATPASATAAYLDNADANGVTVSSIWDTYDDSTNTVRGRIRFEKSTNPAVWAEFNVTGSVVDGTGYRKLTLANGVGSGAFTATDVFSVTFFRSGNSSSGDILAANNLSDVANAATAAGNLSAVRYAAQSLTADQRAQARANIDAVKRNYIDNGGMVISQENGTAAGTASGYFPVDRFSYSFSNTTGVVSCAQVASLTPGGSPNRLRATVTTADASVGSTDVAYILHRIEGSNIVDLRFGLASAKTIVLRFGVKAPAGTYSVAFRNNAANRTYVGEYVIGGGEANTDVVKSVSLTADTSGTWLTDTGVGIDIFFGLMGGSSVHGTVGAWAAGAAPISSNQFNFLGTLSNVFELFDVGLYEGSAAPSFQLEDIGITLRKCQRHFEKSTFNYQSVSGAQTGRAFAINVPFKVSKRAVPTMSLSSSTTVRVSGLSTGTPSTEKFNVTFTNTDASGDDFGVATTWTANSRL